MKKNCKKKYAKKDGFSRKTTMHAIAAEVVLWNNFTSVHFDKVWAKSDERGDFRKNEGFAEPQMGDVLY